MTQCNNCPSTDQLASLTVSGLRSRIAAKIQAHVTQCEPCTHVSQQLNAIPAILASATYPEIPENLAARTGSAISREAQQRLAAMPATETGRRDLPARRPRAATSGRWHLPGLSAAATRLAAAAVAVVIAVAGSYRVAEIAGTSVTPSSPPAGAAAPAQQMSLGPGVTYGQPGSRHTIRAVKSDTNFVAAHLRTQAISAVHAAEARGVIAAQPSASTATQLTGSAADTAPGSPVTASRLAGCIGLIAPGQAVLLIDIARYQGTPATVIVTAATGVNEAEAWVAGSSCSATTKDVLTQAALGNL
jgi:hypothetical protein